jgi:hypothetical protein
MTVHLQSLNSIPKDSTGGKSDATTVAVGSQGQVRREVEGGLVQSSSQVRQQRHMDSIGGVFTSNSTAGSIKVPILASNMASGMNPVLARRVSTSSIITNDEYPMHAQYRQLHASSNANLPAHPSSSSSVNRTPTNCRYDNSLGLLTKKFVSLLKESANGTLDLNLAAAKLEVQKRRIYDITNVLEGIGLIVKKSKNNVQWNGTSVLHSPDDTMQLGQVKHLKEDLEQSRQEELLLDQNIEYVQSVLKSMSEQESNRRLAYLNHYDIRGINVLSEDTLFAIKAPYGSTLEIPDSEPSDKNAETLSNSSASHKKRYEIHLSSKNGPIDVFLIHDPHQISGSTSLGNTASVSVDDFSQPQFCANNINDPQNDHSSDLNTTSKTTNIHSRSFSSLMTEDQPALEDGSSSSTENLLRHLEFPITADSYDFDLRPDVGPSFFYEDDASCAALNLFSAPVLGLRGKSNAGDSTSMSRDNTNQRST